MSVFAEGISLHAILSHAVAHPKGKAVATVTAISLLALLANPGMGASAHAAAVVTPLASLTARLIQLLGPQALPEDLISAAVTTVGARPHTLVNIDAGGRLIPGQIASLYTYAAALATLGSGHTLSTAVVAANAPHNSRVDGNLYLVGGGDLSLTPTALERLAGATARRVRLVTGRLLVDSTAFGPPAWPQGWPAQLASQPLYSPPSALETGAGVVTFRVVPSRVGEPPAIVQVPNMKLPVINRALTAAKGKTSLEIQAMPGRRALALQGQIAVKASPALVVAADPNPARSTGLMFLSDLTQRGVRIEGGLGQGRSPSISSTIAVHSSISLASLIRTAAAFPGPSGAETFVRLLGHLHSPSDSDALDAGVAAVTSQMRQLGVGNVPILHDGSGTSYEDEATAGSLARLLALAQGHAWGKNFFATLPPLSGTGTLPKGAFAVGLKASEIGGTAVAGYVRTRAGTTLAFSFLAEGAAGQPALTAEMAAVGLTAAWPGPFAIERGLPLQQPSPPKWTANLRRALDGVGPGSEVTVDLVDTASGRTIWARSPNVEMPAPGIVPVLVGASAHNFLPSQASTSTRLWTAGRLVGRTLHGALILQGGSDPTFSYADLATLARKVAVLGIHQVTGGVEVADPGPAPESYGLGWPIENETLPQQPPIDSLAVAGDQVSVAVLPAAAAGRPPSVTVVPLRSGLTVTNLATTVPGKADTLRLIWDRGLPRFLLVGTLGRRNATGTVFLRTAPDPAVLCGHLLITALAQVGVQVSGGVTRTLAVGSGSALAAQVASPPFDELSTNVMAAPTAQAAEDLLTFIGGAKVRQGQVPGTSAQGLARVAELIRSAAPGTPSPALFDGSGLSLYDRLASSTVALALFHLAARPDLNQLPNMLPAVTGASNSGLVRAVMAVGPNNALLAGYVTTASGAQLSVCIQFADLDVPAARVEATLLGVAEALRALPLVRVSVGAASR